MAAATSRVLLTGGTGFLGAYILENLLKAGSSVALLDLKEDLSILKQVLSEADLGRIEKFFIDISDTDAVKAAVLKFRPTMLIHMAGVQIPTCKATPALGAKINVVGTINVFEAVKALAEQEKAAPIPVAYASSGAVLGPSSDYAAGGALPAERDYHRPRNIYGVYKLCNEGTARIYWQDAKIPSVGLRPLTIFGVGREIGLTSGPTKAVKAAVLGRPFVIEVTGRTGFHYVDDVAKLFIDAAAGCVRLPGSHVCGIKGHLATYEEFLSEAAKTVPEVAKLASIKAGAPEVPIHGDVDEAPLQVLCGRSELHLSLGDAVADMATRFKELHRKGALHDRDLPAQAKL